MEQTPEDYQKESFFSYHFQDGFEKCGCTSTRTVSEPKAAKTHAVCVKTSWIRNICCHPSAREPAAGMNMICCFEPGPLRGNDSVL